MMFIVELVELCRALNDAYTIAVDLRRTCAEVAEHTTEGIQNIINKPHLRKYGKMKTDLFASIRNLSAFDDTHQNEEQRNIPDRITKVIVHIFRFIKYNSVTVYLA